MQVSPAEGNVSFERNTLAFAGHALSESHFIMGIVQRSALA